MAENERILYLDDQMLQILGHIPNLVKEFPFLGSVAATGCCGSENREVFNIVRSTLVALPEAEKEKFRNLVQAKTVIVFQPGKEAVKL